MKWRVARHASRTGTRALPSGSWLLPLLVPALAVCRGQPAAGAETHSPGAPALKEGAKGSLAAPRSLDAATTQALAAAWRQRPTDYKPRTRHLNADGTPKYTNRLFLETSPYLRQHAHNPVHWYPWGPEAFGAAMALGRPVLLSVGYSTCHWCHVMEEESFEDEEIAAFINANYVAIKVDREERPDIDGVYMKAVTALTGRGGWPMTVWLTPDGHPYHGGTYFPARDGDRGARTGFLTLLATLKQAFDSDPEGVANQAQRIAALLKSSLVPEAGGELPTAAVLAKAILSYRQSFDETYGGLSRAPKFPSSLPIRLLLRYHRRTGDKDALRMATRTLEKMAAGGMYDHVGGGFHRYSTDRRWLVPHFEKMLYDNALLTLAYLDGYQVTGKPTFGQVVREILRFVERDMTSPDGAFYSATDADSLTPDGHREEGWFFTWTPEELVQCLGKERARVVQAYYAVDKGGNFEGRSILHTPRPLQQVAAELGESPSVVRATIEDAKEILYAERNKRPLPIRDDKILTAWNGLMISAHARAAHVLEEPLYAERAGRAADFLLTQMRSGERLWRSYKDGQAKHNAYLDDYAFLVTALLDLYETTGTTRWLAEARKLDQILKTHFAGPSGGYFMTSDDHEELLAREMPAYDGAIPSGNSQQALNLLRLHELTTDDDYRKRATSLLRALGKELGQSPTALSELLVAVDFFLDVPKELVLVVPKSRAQAEPFLDVLRLTFVPNSVMAVVVEGADAARHAALVPFVAQKKAQSGKATAYVCEKGICELPTTDPSVFKRLIEKVHAL